MSDDYEVLAPVYESLGMGAFAEALTPQLIQYAQMHDWLGRRVVDLGCGTGKSVRWLANHGYNVTGVDLSPSMLRVAQANMTGSGVSFQLYEGDLRALHDLHDIDLVLTLDTLNELGSLRDLEAAFASAARILPPEKLFIFDLRTIEGLTAGDSPAVSLTETDEMTAFRSHQFDYERQSSSDSFVLFMRRDSLWERQTAVRMLRGFPIQVAAALLQRAGFGIMALLNARMEAVDAAALHEPRVIVIAQRAS